MKKTKRNEMDIYTFFQLARNAASFSNQLSQPSMFPAQIQPK